MNLEFKTTDGYEFSAIEVYVDGIEAGHIEVEKTDDYDADIRYIEILEDFRGKGLFIHLVKAVFKTEEFEDCDTLRSFHRFESTANAVYSKWLGVDLKTTNMAYWKWDKWDEKLTLCFKDIEIIK